MIALKKHYPVFIFVFVGIVLMIVLSAAAPREPLLEKARELESSEYFLCEDGTIWAPKGETSEGGIVAEQTDQIDPGGIKNSFRDALPGELSAVEYAQATTMYGQVCVRQDGSVWSCEKLNDTELLLTPFYYEEPTAVREGNALITPPSGGPYSAFFDVVVRRGDGYEDLIFTLALKLSDGWHVVDRDGMSVYRVDHARDITDVLINGVEYKHYEESVDDIMNYSGELSTDNMYAYGQYRISVYAARDDETVLIAEHEMTTDEDTFNAVLICGY